MLLLFWGLIWSSTYIGDHSTAFYISLFLSSQTICINTCLAILGQQYCEMANIKTKHAVLVNLYVLMKSIKMQSHHEQPIYLVNIYTSINVEPSSNMLHNQLWLGPM